MNHLLCCLAMHVFVGVIALDVFEALSPKYAEAMRKTAPSGTLRYLGSRLCCALAWPWFAVLAIQGILEE